MIKMLLDASKSEKIIWKSDAKSSGLHFFLFQVPFDETVLNKKYCFFSKYVTADSKMWLSDSYLGVQAH